MSTIKNLHDVRSAYLAYMRECGHVELPSSPLVPENDPTTLFTGSGMQPLIPYLLGKDHPSGTRLVNSQKCFRSGDIDEVGDNRHTTFFEMLGNWSLGEYGKEEQLTWFFHFLTEVLELDPQRLYVTVFAGDEHAGVQQDDISASIWQKLFAQKEVSAMTARMVTEEEAAVRGMHEGERIFFYREKNWWSRAGAPHTMPAGEPGGPDSEVFYEFSDIQHDVRFGDHCHVNCDCGRYLEIGNSVFMQYRRIEDGTFERLPKQNVDFGGGLERLTMAVCNTPDIVAVCHAAIIEYLERVTGRRYGVDPEETRAFRIIADHMKAAVFLIGDGVHPGNADQGYFVRRLIRRAVRYADKLGVHEDGFAAVVEPVVAMYERQYPVLRVNVEDIRKSIEEEERKFRRTIGSGLRKIEKLLTHNRFLTAEQLFDLYQTDGFPFEVSLEILRDRSIDVPAAVTDSFRILFEAHKEKSRTGSEQKFKGGLADAGERTTMLHTCTHLMLAALRRELGDHVHQAGSNITAERARFDFTHSEKVSREVLDRVERYVNEAIQKGCTVDTLTMDKLTARAAGIEGSFWDKYPELVTVYRVQAPDGTIYSQELCGGPHVDVTTAIRGTFKIVKEEASSSGVRRVKAVLTLGDEVGGV
ncbi:MAG: alanine--tRNA ligase [Candidatus Pacebacteria bacterium]|nr:alanine--tRNA ligase [Candidatus Paceibacterota bacterium]